MLAALLAGSAPAASAAFVDVYVFCTLATVAVALTALWLIEASQAPRLITIPISHYCEKARWALERADIPYREERHLQVIHWAHVWRAGRGRTAPVLVTRTGR